MHQSPPKHPLHALAVATSTFLHSPVHALHVASPPHPPISTFPQAARPIPSSRPTRPRGCRSRRGPRRLRAGVVFVGLVVGLQETAASVYPHDQYQFPRNCGPADSLRFALTAPWGRRWTAVARRGGARRRLRCDTQRSPARTTSQNQLRAGFTRGEQQTRTASGPSCAAPPRRLRPG
ncbi:hypothetical protein BV20DRAFT_972329 [Pilatotrama ljubarskyi]|nr:hypothetical protein BV20DRAFT_972329 [Pilatotrama ljubarskyi]